MNELSEKLINILKSYLSVVNITASNDEISIRCPYCGDSVKSQYHTHLYIGINNENNIFPYYCHKCNAKGIVDKNFFKDIKVYDFNLISNIETINRKERQNLFKNKSISKSIKNNLIIPSFNGSKSSSNKLKYINSRYSFNLDPEEYINNYKTIFSFKDFIIQNNIEYLNASEYMIKQLVKNYIGFLSNDGNFITFRNIDPNCDKKHRYYIYNIFNNDFGKRFYTCKSKVNLLTDKVNIVIAEGVFDIIGIKEYFYKDKNTDYIFSAVCGTGYNLVFNHFARLGFLNMNIEIYSDSDVDIKRYIYMKNNNNIMKNNNIKIYYNALEKDYGLKKNRISLKHNFI